MPIPPLEPSGPKSVLPIESDRTLALTLQDLLFSLIHETLDLAMACSLREGLMYLSTHQVPLILIGLGVSDYNGLDPVRTLRVSARGNALIAYGTVVQAPLHLDVLRAGAHEVLSLADASTDTFQLIAERAMVRAVASQLEADSPPPV